MVFLHFPTQLTDEELALQAKYVKLRKKKKALQDFTKPKVEVEKSNPLKRTLEPKEATELAKKLVLAGKISVGGSKGTAQKTMFKRPLGLERKLNESKGSATPTAIATILQSTNTQNSTTAVTASASSSSSAAAEVISYTPFTSSTFNSNSKRTPKQTAIVAPIRKVEPTPATTNTGDEEPTPGPSNPNRFGSFNRGGRGGGLGYNRYEASNQPKPGHTVHVKAISGMRKLTEDFCREVFGKIGNIVNIAMELDRNCGFITYDKVEIAEKAINELDKSYHRDILLQVSFARRQPPLSDLMSNPSPSLLWKHLASNPNQQKSNHQDKRAQVSYNDTIEEPF